MSAGNKSKGKQPLGTAAGFGYDMPEPQYDGQEENSDFELLEEPVAAPSTKVVVMDKAAMYSARWDFKEPEPYPTKGQLDHLVHRAYDGRDAPLKQEMESEGCSMTNPTPCIVAFDDLLDTTGNKLVFGTGLKGKAQSQTGGPWISVSLLMYSQFPSIRIDVKLNEGRKVSAFIFAEAIKRGPNKDDKTVFQPELGFVVQPDQKFIEQLPAHPELYDYVERQELMKMEVQLWNFEVLESGRKPLPVGPRPRQIMFQGIDPKELHDLYNQLVKGEKLDERLQFIALLWGSAESLSIYRYWPNSNEAHQAAKKACQWFLGAMSCVTNFGSLWFYFLQLGNTMHGYDAPLGDVAIPRWLVNSWLVTLDLHTNAMIKCEPRTWSPFRSGALDQILPDPRTMAFVYALGIERDRAFQSKILRTSLEAGGKWVLTADFYVDRRYPDVYIVALAQSDGKSILSKDKNMRPSNGCRLSLYVRQPGQEKKANPRTICFKGVISEDILGIDAEVCAVVSGLTIHELQQWFPDFESGSSFPVLVQLDDDPTPANRHRGAIYNVRDGWDDRNEEWGKRKGWDIAHDVLRAPRTIIDTDSLAKELEGVDGAMDAYKQTIQRWQLNERQLASAMNSLTSKCGLTHIQGPPGTGKSACLAAIAEGHMVVGKVLNKKRQVLMCAPSNLAVEALLRKFRDYSDPAKPYHVVLFKGALLREPRQSKDKDNDTVMKEGSPKPVERHQETRARLLTVDPMLRGEALLGEDMDADEQDRLHAHVDDTIEALDRQQDAIDAVWDLAEEKNPFNRREEFAEFGFHAQRKATIKHWAGLESHQMTATARRYLDVQDKLQDNDLERGVRAELKEERNDLEDDIDEFYFDNVVDIVFATCSMSAHPPLRRFCKPRILMLDEAAVTSVPDTATPCGAFMPHIEHGVMAGDHKQGTPIVLSTVANEMAEHLRTSLFESVLHHNTHTDFKFVLDVQYRMHPHISAFVSQSSYAGNLKDHESTKALTPKWLTMEDYLKGFGPAWKDGRRRLALDVSGQEVMSRKKRGGTSWSNEAEADRIARFIAKACLHTPPTDMAERVIPSDFLVLTPYADQVDLIRAKLREARVGMQKGNRVRVLNTRVIQGEEGMFVMCSLVRNTPGRPLDMGFVSDSHSLNVAFSRAQQCLFVCGNISKLTQLKLNGNEAFLKGQKLGYFGMFLDDVFKNKDIIANADVMQFLAGQTIEKASVENVIKVPPKPKSGKGPLPHAKPRDNFDRLDDQSKKRNFSQLKARSTMAPPRQEQAPKNEGQGEAEGSKKKKRQQNKRKKKKKAKADDADPSAEAVEGEEGGEEAEDASGEEEEEAGPEPMEQ